MASSLEFNKTLAAILTAGILASGTGVLSRMLYHPSVPEEPAYPIEVAASEEGGGEAEAEGGGPAPDLGTLLASASVETGEATAKKCASCHDFAKGGANKIGPHLWGVLGRPVGSVEDFAYSEPMKSHGGNWDYASLDGFLASPKGYIAGTKMSFAGLKKPEERAGVIAYLRSLSDNPEPLPAPAEGGGEQAAAPEEAAPPAEQQGAAEGEPATPAEPAQEQAAAPAEPAQPAEPPAEQAPADQQQANAAPADAPAEAGNAAAAGGAAGGLAALLASSDMAAGEKVAKKCKACHSLEKDGKNKIGPHLWGVVGRPVGSVADFSYSEAMKSHGGNWDLDTLNTYLTNPKGYVPGTKMAFAGVKKDDERAALLLYLRSLSDNPVPLPGQG